jgi:hypothetical protein
MSVCLAFRILPGSRFVRTLVEFIDAAHARLVFKYVLFDQMFLAGHIFSLVGVGRQINCLESLIV